MASKAQRVVVEQFCNPKYASDPELRKLPEHVIQPEYLYKVVKLTNRLEPSLGLMVTPKALSDLIEAGVTVDGKESDG
jgi:hypothetical protein